MYRDGERGCRRVRRIALSALGLLLAAGAAARADVIVLRGGSELRGKVLDDLSGPKATTVRVLLTTGKNPLVLPRDRIVKVVPEAGVLDDYLEKKQQTSATAQAEYELGLWCEQNRLADLALGHFEAAVKLDNTLAPAHKKLGHVLRGDRWLSRDEVNQVQGLVKYRGKWVTEEEKAKREESSQLSSSQAVWVRRIKKLREIIAAGPEARRREAEIELMQIHEIEAVVPLTKVLGQDQTAFRNMLVQVLGRIEGKQSTRALVNVLLAEPEDSLRTMVLEQLLQRDGSESVPLLNRALRSSNYRVINRAAWALGRLEAVTAVPKLVEVLVTTEERIVMPLEHESSGASLGTGPGLSLMGVNRGSAAFLTPPAMAPGGVVAYGAVGVPLGAAGPVMGGGGFFGLNMQSGRGPIPRVVTDAYQNVEVLAALVKLTGQDLGYDVLAWKRWIKASFNPNPNPVRRVPQP